MKSKRNVARLQPCFLYTGTKNEQLFTIYNYKSNNILRCVLILATLHPYLPPHPPPISHETQITASKYDCDSNLGMLLYLECVTSLVYYAKLVYSR